MTRRHGLPARMGAGIATTLLAFSLAACSAEAGVDTEGEGVQLNTDVDVSNSPNP